MPSTNNVIKDEKTKTVTIRQEAYTLEQGTFLKDYHHIIYATTVNVMKGFVNPGCDLTIYCARLVVDQAGGKIDVSGADGKGYTEGNREDANTFNGYDGGDGKEGADGKPGQNGGKVEIHAAHILGGTLEVISRGGNGGRAQDGGNGKAGQQPKEAPQKPEVPKQVVVGYDWVVVGNQSRKVPRYGWGDDVKEIGRGGWTNSAYLLVTHKAKSGRPGGNGGNAGLAGRPGNGGNGGSVTVRSLGDLKVTITTHLGGGEKGATADHGSPGGGAEGGPGAQYLYKSSVGTVDTDWATFENEDLKSVWTKRRTFIDHFKDLGVNDKTFVDGEGEDRKLKEQASSGPQGKNGGYGPTGVANKPAVREAENGRPANYTAGMTDATGATYATFPYPYLLMLQRSATGALLNRDNDEAADILRWLMVLTTYYRNALPGSAPEAMDRKGLYYEAEHSLLTLNRDDSAERRAPRCAITDIKSYSSFVETLLTHVTTQEKNLNHYLAAEGKLAALKEALKNNIQDAEDRVKHLTGDKMTPGSILYNQEKEKQLKAAISALDVQLLDYKSKLEKMPRALQDEIDGQIRKKTDMSIWTVLELVGMAAGIAFDFVGAVGSLKTMVKEVKDFYKTTMELSTIGDILKKGIWEKEFTELKEDLKKLLETDAWKGLSDDKKKFITSVTDFRAKIDAYLEIINSRQDVKFKLDKLDVEASVLIFNTAKLELKKQRNNFAAFIRAFINEYQQAQEWKHLFADYFDTTETRFDMLAHLADIQAERRELEYQREICGRNLVLLREEKNKLDFDPEKLQGDDVRTSLEANVNIAIDQALNLIMEEGRAYTIWTLFPYGFPKISENLSSTILRSKFHNPVWEKINTKKSTESLPPNRDFSPFVWKREDYKQQFELFDKTGRITLSLPVNKNSQNYFERLIDARIYLVGAKAKAGSPFYCRLRHCGISDFLKDKDNVTTCYQEPRTIVFSYVVAGEGADAEPNYNYHGAIDQSFDLAKDKLNRIRYSPYTTWEVQIVRNYQPDDRSPTVYNQEIDLNSIQAIQLRGRVLYEDSPVKLQAQNT